VGPITATSLNLRDGAPARTRADATRLCQDAETVRLLEVEGAEAGGDAASTVIDTSGERPQVLRWGAIPRDELESFLEGVRN
jgi:tRNA A37 threonylcarbamoyladenosine synthetase subunit TsaC/SUA5/YrdC